MTERLQEQLTYSRKQTAYAWAKYYEEVKEHLTEARGQYTIFRQTEAEVMIPTHIKEEMKAMANALKKKWECPVCLEMIEEGQLEITNCGHYYCKECLITLQSTAKADNESKWKCATCRKKHNYKEIVVPVAQPVAQPVRRRRPIIAQ